jgi:transcription elongation factor Elf1
MELDNLKKIYEKTEVIMKKLLPCPFCGGEAMAFVNEETSFVSCLKCGCELYPIFEEPVISWTYQEAIDNWNKRVNN